VLEIIYQEEKLGLQTLDYIKESEEEVSVSIKDIVESKINEIIYSITEKYNNIRFDKEMRLQFYEPILKEWKSIDYLSAGSIEQMYIALRLAIIEITKGVNDYPLVFDDSFVQYDKKRLIRIIQYIASLNRQVIILTCHQRENAALTELNIPHKYIQLA
jgi:uncharacterized protein YhaN